MRKVKREYKKVERRVSHIDAEQFLRRHEYCVTVQHLIRNADEATIARFREKGQLKGHCDHPEDGYCSSFITPEKLEEVNARLASNTAPESSEKPVEAPEIKSETPTTTPAKMTRYFCLNCKEFHEDKPEHLEYRRRQGRPKK